MDFIQVVKHNNIYDREETKQKHTSSLSISDKRPHTLGVVGIQNHGSDVFFDKLNAEKMIAWLEKSIKTMVKYDCEICGSYMANFSKCEHCKQIK